VEARGLLRRSLSALDDIAIITVSTNEAHWLRPCLSTVFAHLGDVRADVVVVDNDSHDETSQLVASEFPHARVVRCANHGFPHANNRALMSVNARYVLFLNPDTEIVRGTFEDLLRELDARPTLGVIGVKQVDKDGVLDPTIRRFPTALRALGEALAVDRWPVRPKLLGEREMNERRYDTEVACDWVTGSFLLARREAIESAGFMDERLFMYSDEPDLCVRIKSAGWEVRHLPSMAIIHHGKTKLSAKIESLGAWTRRFYARKHLSPAHAAAFTAALFLRHGLRAFMPGGGEPGAHRRDVHRAVLLTMLGRRPVPYGPPSELSVRIGTPEHRRRDDDRVASGA
jgi:N-acetylglucosaminyl-diphospho-decaprenol L-rhamnosyltransferase